MKTQSLIVVSLLGLFCTSVYAEQATGLCKDGTAWTGPSKRGACRGHKGVQEWYADKQAAPAASSPAPSQAPAATPTASAPAAAASPPAGGAATGLCKDGTAWTGPSKRGACRGHKGVQEWYADKQSAPAVSTPAAPGTSVSGTATGLCKDGTEYTGSSKRGACRGHKGLQEWYADKQSAPASAPAAATAPATPAAAAPAGAPSAAATGICKDGTEYTGASKRGACRGHKGLKEWFGDKAAAPAPSSTTAPAAAPAASSPATPAQAASPAQTAQPAAPAAAPAATAASTPAGQVWVNTNSKIYHCPGSKYFGKTKEGEYMDEAQAQAKGFVPNRKKTCGLAR